MNTRRFAKIQKVTGNHEATRRYKRENIMNITRLAIHPKQYKGTVQTTEDNKNTSRPLTAAATRIEIRVYRVPFVLNTATFPQIHTLPKYCFPLWPEGRKKYGW